MLLLILTYALFASAFSFNKAILGISSPIFLAGIRTFISGLVLLTYSFNSRSRTTIEKKDIPTILQISILSIFLHSVLKNYALQNMTSIKTGFFGNLDPFIAALLAYILLSEKLSKKKWLGLLVAFSGAVVYLFSSSPSEQALGEIAILSLPEIAIIFAIAINRFGWFKIQYLLKEKKYSSPQIIGLAMLIGGILSLISSYFIEMAPRVTNIKSFIIYLTYIIISSNIIGYNLYAHLHKIHSATLVTLVGFSQPLFVTLYGMLFLGESLSWYYIISTALVFLGVSIFYRD